MSDTPVPCYPQPQPQIPPCYVLSWKYLSEAKTFYSTPLPPWSPCDGQHYRGVASTHFQIQKVTIIYPFGKSVFKYICCYLAAVEKKKKNSTGMRGVVRFSDTEPQRTAAIDGWMELPSANNPAVKWGSPPCGINKTEELRKGMEQKAVEEKKNSCLPFMNVQQHVYFPRCCHKKLHFSGLKEVKDAVVLVTLNTTSRCFVWHAIQNESPDTAALLIVCASMPNTLFASWYANSEIWNPTWQYYPGFV